MKQPYSRSL